MRKTLKVGPNVRRRAATAIVSTVDWSRKLISALRRWQRLSSFSHEWPRQLRGSGCLDRRIPRFIFHVATEKANSRSLETSMLSDRRPLVSSSQVPFFLKAVFFDFPR